MTIRAFFTRAVFGALCFTSLNVQLHAAEASSEPVSNAGPSAGWGLGLGLGVQKKAYSGADTRLKVLPNFYYDNRWVRVAGTGIDVKAGSLGAVSFALRTRLALGDGYKSSDADILDGMNKRKGSVWVGPSLLWRTALVDVAAEALMDASAYSKGTQASLSVAHSFRQGPWSLEPRLSMNWLSAKYVDYYYGVEAAEARLDRAAYDGRATLNLSTSLRLGYAIDKHQSLSLDAGVRRLGNSIVDSPLVDKRTQPIFGMGYMYRF
ncbi:MipA/OmpV family protein [Uliginosibacterium sediminicola]|uniref:MipA/OmpV family protein n=1 Tax=Uliginosibacterium sediminicola TaxID=2024550 RepID=A0ABU9YVQ3_9RHOO